MWKLVEARTLLHLVGWDTLSLKYCRSVSVHLISFEKKEKGILLIFMTPKFCIQFSAVCIHLSTYVYEIQVVVNYQGRSM